MNYLVQSAVVLVVFLFLGGHAALAKGARIVSVQSPRGVQQLFLLTKPEHAVASVILFAGGNGALRLNTLPPSAGDAYPYSGNFLVRSREKFVSHDFIVAVVDVPSDRAGGIEPSFRVSREQVVDIGAVVEYLKSQAGVPVWLVGTSQGSWSAARVAIGASRGDIATDLIDGLVLTSTVTRIAQGSPFAKTFPDFSKEYPNGVINLALSDIKVPTLIMSHRDDACDLTPAVDSEALAKGLSQAAKVEIVLLSGGDVPKSDPCEAYSAHGYYGIETQAVDRITDFIISNKSAPRLPFTQTK